MDSIELTTTEFRQNQKKFLDLAASGVSLLICRGKELFMLNRVSNYRRVDDDTIAQINKAREEMRKGEAVKVSTREELEELLKSL